MAERDRRLGVPLLRFHQWLYEATDGWVGHRLGRVRMLLLTTRGRRSGQVRTAALLYRRDGDRLVVVGSKGGSDRPPAWLLNLQAHPDVGVQVGREHFEAQARLATADEQARLWPAMVRIWPDYERYQSQTTRRIPLVILEPR